MNITGYALLRFKSNGGKVSWKASVRYNESEDKAFYITYPVTFSKKEVEEQVKKEFKSRKWTKEDKFININVKRVSYQHLQIKKDKRLLNLSLLN